MLLLISSVEANVLSTLGNTGESEKNSMGPKSLPLYKTLTIKVFLSMCFMFMEEICIKLFGL